MIHVHVRRADGRHLLDAAAFRAARDAIAAAVGDRLVIQATSESLGLYTPAEQAAVVRALRPEAVSLALRELVPDTAAEAGFADLLAWMRRENVLPQIILYEPDEAVRLDALMRRGLVPWNDVPVLFALGRYTEGQTSQPADLLPFLAPGMPRFGHWMVCAFGCREAASVSAAALLGGHVRVGFENNSLRPDGAAAASNADLVAPVANALHGLGQELSDAASLRSAWYAVLEGTRAPEGVRLTDRSELSFGRDTRG
jgi:uncharacterized protein (DUF849 family)